MLCPVGGFVVVGSCPVGEFGAGALVMGVGGVGRGGPVVQGVSFRPCVVEVGTTITQVLVSVTPTG